MRLSALFAVVAFLVVGQVEAASSLTDTRIAAKVISVHDGDTIVVDAYPWPKVTIRVAVRLRGIDTAELHGDCVREEELAYAARDFLRAFVEEEMVTLTDPGPDKYFGRVVAGVEFNSIDLAAYLLENGHGRPYEGGTRGSWCGGTMP